MQTLASVLLACSAGLALLLGSLHLLYTFLGTKLHPRDDALRRRMQEVALIISRKTTIWRAGIGFHASHDFGLLPFGALYLYFSLGGIHFLAQSYSLLGIGFAYLLAMAVLARLYWFSVPFRGISLALALYAAAVVALVV